MPASSSWWRPQPGSFVTVPSKRKPVRSNRRSGSAAGIVVILIVAVVAYLALKPSARVPPPRATLCVAGPDGQGLELTTGQAAIAATIAGVASDRHMPTRAVAIAYATALQESKLTNLHYGDRDSVGVFQQRPSEGWGTTQQIEDPVYATSRFFEALAAVPNYLHLPIYMAAQAVQHSADGTAYAQYADMGSEMATAFTGSEPRGVWCTYGSAPGKARLAAASQSLTSAFGPLSRHVSGDPAETITGLDPQQGWAVASWLAANASEYGITFVRYQGSQWLGFRGAGHWTAEPARKCGPCRWGRDARKRECSSTFSASR